MTLPDIAFDRYYSYDEMTERLHALVAAAGDGRHRLAAEDRRDHLVRRAVPDAGQHDRRMNPSA